MLDLDGIQEFDASLGDECFSRLPSRPGVILIEMKDAAGQPYLSRTADIRRTAERLLRAPETLSKRLNLREIAGRIRFRATGSKFEQTLAFYEQSRNRLPNRYRDLLRLRGPALLKVNLRNAYPRCYVTRRISADGGFYFGPFASRRSAETFAEGFLDLFKIRRCQIKIRHDPNYPGCIYSEMKMCLAPCFAGCTKEEYDVEVGRVVETLATTGTALRESLEREREVASEALDFERAAAVHKRIEKSSDALRGLPEIARRIEYLDAAILTRSVESKTVIVFAIRAGLIAEPVFLRFGELSSEPRSVEAILRKILEARIETNQETCADFRNGDSARALSVSGDGERIAARQPITSEAEILPASARYGLRSAPRELSEHLVLLARWFYSNPRDGEIFFREAGWPYRRILRACGRLLSSPDRPQPAA